MSIFLPMTRNRAKMGGKRYMQKPNLKFRVYFLVVQHALVTIEYYFERSTSCRMLCGLITLAKHLFSRKIFKSTKKVSELYADKILDWILALLFDNLSSYGLLEIIVLQKSFHKSPFLIIFSHKIIWHKC